MTTQLYTSTFLLPIGTTTVKFATVVNGALTATQSAVYTITTGTYAASITESATSTDTVEATTSYYPVAVSEVTSATDTVSATTAYYPVAIAEVASATDSVGTDNTTYAASLTESAEATDVFLTTATYSVSQSEVAIAEDASWEMPYKKEVIMPVSLCPMPKMQLLKDNGTPAAGYYLYTYVAGQPGVFKPTFIDSTGSVQNSDPIVLDAAGRANIWLAGHYYMELWTGNKNVAGSTLVWTQDNVSGGDSASTTNSYYRTSDYSTFDLAVAAATGGALIVDSSVVVTANTTISTVALTVQYPSHISIDSGKTLTINTPFTCGLFQCFSGSGSVVFSAGSVTEVYPEWWGAVGDGVVDDYLPISKALANSANSRFVLSPKTYFTTGEMAVPNGCIFDGRGAIILYTPTVDENAIRIQSSNVAITNLTIRPLNVTAGANGVRRMPIVIGEYGLSGTNSYSNIKLDGITILGGHTTLNMIAIGMYGPVSNVDISNINIKGGVTYGYPATGIQAHWGAVGVLASTTTLHPHNIRISNVFFENIGVGATVEQPSCIFLSGTYDVSITGAHGRTVNTGIYIFPGDRAFASAGAEDGTHTRSISISDSDFSDVTRYGARVVGLAGGSNIDAEIKNVEFSGNSTTSSTCVGVGSYLVSSGLVVSLSRFSGFYQGINLTNTSSAIISGNKISGNGRQGIILSTGSKNTISYNNFINNNTTSQTTNGGAIQLEGTSAYNRVNSNYFQGSTTQPNHYYNVRITVNTVTNSTIHDNLFGDTVSTTALSNGAGADWLTLQTYADNNMIIGANIVYPVGGGVTFSERGGNLSVYGTAAPVSGTWRQGDIFYNSAPAASGSIGWVCTVAGTPGTWKAFGAISA